MAFVQSNRKLKNGTGINHTLFSTSTVQKKKKNLHYSQGLTLALMIKQSLFFLFQDSAYKTSLITAKDKTQEL